MLIIDGFRFLNLLIFCTNFLNGFASYIHFPSGAVIAKNYERNIINAVSSTQLNEFIRFALQSRDHQKSLEQNILNKQITVKNNTISHRQLLDSLPNTHAQYDISVAQKILFSSLYIYNNICAPRNINGKQCEEVLREKSIPVDNELAKNCIEVVKRHNQNQHYFRRLLPRHYKDGFHQMFNHLPEPLRISQMLNENQKIKHFDEQNRNLVLVQWTQFVEHDLSKPVFTPMGDGSAVECCDGNNYKLQSRYRHPLCAPLVFQSNTDVDAPVKCLNYVRSALSVGNACTFAAREQFNQATSNLDLSQLYGNSLEETQYLRTFKRGLLKSYSNSSENIQEVLFFSNNDTYKFCTNSNPGLYCFLSGDSRVNRSPLSITIYTLFLRNHNRLARYLNVIYPRWDDEKLFQTSKSLNIQTYQNIMLKEWLGELLSHSMAKNLINYSNKINRDFNSSLISNEFGVAAIRFYLSMLPDTIKSYKSDSKAVISLSKEIYEPSFHYTNNKLNDIMISLFQQRAMNVDPNYENSFKTDIDLEHSATRSDVLAFDIQRNRDHGLQPYVKYLEICENIKILGWLDLLQYIPQKMLIKLKSIYRNYRDIDLIVGGMAEKPLPMSITGPTFQCIISEQFSKIPYYNMEHILQLDPKVKDIINAKGFDLLCINFNMSKIPRNIFRLPSDINPMISCSRAVE